MTMDGPVAPNLIKPGTVLPAIKEETPIWRGSLSSGRNKYQSRESRASIRKVLMEAWDPIGVHNAPEAQDEYDAYVSKAYVMLMDEKASEQAIAAYLYDIATSHMGLPPTALLMERSTNAAHLIARLRPSFETH